VTKLLVSHLIRKSSACTETFLELSYFQYQKMLSGTVLAKLQQTPCAITEFHANIASFEIYTTCFLYIKLN